MCRVRSLAFVREWIDASGEGCDAVGARSSTFDVCRGFQTRGGAPHWYGGVDGASNDCALQVAWADLAVAETISDSDLEARIYKSASKKQGYRRIIEPDWASLHREMKRKHVTLSILWDEYIVGDPHGYRYSRFCELYRSWEDKISVTMRQAHLGGDKLFVDYAGDAASVVIDRLTGEIRKARYLSPSLGHRASPMRRPRGRNRLPTGSARTRVPSRLSIGGQGSLL